MDAADVIVAAGPSIVAIAAVAATVWQQQRRFAHERSLHDVDELRDILDDAADAIRQVRFTVAKPAGPDWVEEGLVRLVPLQQRLIIRLKPDAAVTNVVGRCIAILRRIDALYDEHARSIDSEEAEDAFWDAFEALRDEFAAEADQYIDAARGMVGSRLVVRDSPGRV